MGRQIDWHLGSKHHEQGLCASGTLRVGSDTWAVSGPAVRDHSVGSRDFTPIGGHVWTFAVWPESGRTVCAFNMWGRGSFEVVSTLAVVIEHDQVEILNDFRMSGSTMVGGQPSDMALDIVRSDGSLLQLTGSVVHNFTLTYGEPNFVLNGHASKSDAPGGYSIADESIVRWLWPDGEPTYAACERHFRSEMGLRSPAPVRRGSAFADDIAALRT
jgi:hypothetical protein